MGILNKIIGGASGSLIDKAVQVADKFIDTPEEKKVGMYRETLQEGEAFINFSAGGAGWGDPANRDPDAIAEDIQDGLCRPMSNI